MASAVRNPEEQLEGGLTFMRPLPGAAVLPVEDAPTQITLPQGQSPSQLFHRLFPQSVDGESPSQFSVTGLELGHFVLEERIGRGGMGAVFRALDRGLDRVVALKVLSPEQSADPASVQRFHNEAKAAAQLDHNNIARVHYIGRDRGIHFIAFEFVVGTTIRELIVQRGRLSVSDAVNYTLQIADALRHTAAAQVIHRDIKPSNIIITPSGRAKLVDLGLARQTQGKGEELTVAGTALGTFDYISPEQAIDARNVDVRSDIYSLGCTLYHMLTGEPPYPRGSMFEKVMNHHRASPPDPCLKNREVPPALGAIVQKMMASNPDDRYQNPDQLSQELAALGVSLGMRPVSLESPAWSPWAGFPAGRRRWEGVHTWLTAAVVLLGAVVLVDKIPWDRSTSSSTGPEANSLVQAEGAATRPASPAEEISVPPSAATIAAPEMTRPPGSEAVAGSPVVAATETPVAPVTNALPIPSVSDILPPAPDAGVTVATDRTRADSPKSLEDPEFLISNLQLSMANTIDRLTAGINGMGVKVPPPMQTPSVPVAASPERGLGSAVTGDVPTAPVEVPLPVSTASVDPFQVLSTDGTKVSYATLAEACFRAEDGAIIELWFDGRLSRAQPPLRITRKRLTLRPAEGYRPVLAFALDSSALPTGKTVSMISLSGGALEIYNVDLEMRVDSQSAVDHWSLFTCSGTSELELVGASLTMINPQELPAAFIEIPVRDGGSDVMPDKMYRDPLSLRMLNSIVRGQADLVTQRNTEPLRLQLMNVGAAISGVALRLAGDSVFSMTMREDEVLNDIELQHVTLISDRGLMHADSGDHGQFLPVKFHVRDSLFSVLAPDHPLISVVGHEEFDELQHRLTWTTSRDNNFFELTGPMWRILSPLSQFVVKQDYSFAEWGDFWGQGSDRQVLTGLFRNSRLAGGEAMHRFQRSDFELRPSTLVINPAIAAASDRRDSGVDWTQNQLPAKFPELLLGDR